MKFRTPLLSTKSGSQKQASWILRVLRGIFASCAVDGSCKISQAVKQLADVGALRVAKLLLFLWLHDRESVWKHDRTFLGSLKKEQRVTRRNACQKARHTNLSPRSLSPCFLNASLCVFARTSTAQPQISSQEYRGYILVMSRKKNTELTLAFT